MAVWISVAFRVSHGSVDKCGFQSLAVSCIVLQCGSVWLRIGLTGVKNRRQLYGRDKKVIQSDQDYDDDGDDDDDDDSDDDDGDNNMMMRLHFMRIYICIQLNMCVSSFSTRID